MIKQQITEWLNSFNSKDDGMSRMKTTAYTITLCIVAIHIAWLKTAMMKDDFALLPEVLYADSSLVLLLLGVKGALVNSSKKIDANINNGNNDGQPKP
jgi:hypothetical protein